MGQRLQSIDGVAVIETRVHSDNRGHFCETWNANRLSADFGISTSFVQDNMSYSKEILTVRGLHFQAPPHAQAKLVRVGRGRVFDVAVDFRFGSPTFGDWMGVELSAENGKQLYIPSDFLHGFVTLEPDTEVLYKCSNFYAPNFERSVRFDDPDLAIDWGVNASRAVLSDKDAKALLWTDVSSPFKFVGKA